MKKILFLLLVIPMKLLGQGEGSPKNAIASNLSEQYRLSVIDEDTTTLLAMLHPQVKFYPSTGQMLAGNQLVGSMIKSYLQKNDVNKWKIEILQTEEIGDAIMELGVFEIEENSSSTSKMKYLNIWVPDKGQHKLYYRGWSPLE